MSNNENNLKGGIVSRRKVFRKGFFVAFDLKRDCPLCGCRVTSFNLLSKLGYQPFDPLFDRDPTDPKKVDPKKKAPVL